MHEEGRLKTGSWELVFTLTTQLTLHSYEVAIYTSFICQYLFLKLPKVSKETPVLLTFHNVSRKTSTVF